MDTDSKEIVRLKDTEWGKELDKWENEQDSHYEKYIHRIKLQDLSGSIRGKWLIPENTDVKNAVWSFYLEQKEIQLLKGAEEYTYEEFWQDYLDGWPSFGYCDEVFKAIKNAWEQLPTIRKVDIIGSEVRDVFFNYGRLLRMYKKSGYKFSMIQIMDLKKDMELLKELIETNDAK